MNKKADSFFNVSEKFAKGMIESCNDAEFRKEQVVFMINDEERWFEVNKNDFDINRKLTNYLLFDITEQKKAEYELKTSQKQLVDIIDFLPDATLAIDMTGYVIIWNKANEKTTGIPASEMIGKDDYAYAIPYYG